MRIIKTQRELAKFRQRLRLRAPADNPAVESSVRSILEDVAGNGDRAVLQYTRRFDNPSARGLRLSDAAVARMAEKADRRVVRALSASAKRIRKFHQRQAERSWSFREGDTILGQSIRPLERVGVYVPGGKAAYPSTVLMNVIPAQVAGVKEIALCVPSPNGEINPYVMAAVRMLGVTEVYGIGGAQAIGALAYGTKSVRKVDKIVGPGNIYVATAKKMVFGLVDIDMIAGPSEILVIADSTADPAFVAADLLGQAEHDELASSILVTDSPELAKKVAEELEAQLAVLTRRTIARAAIEGYGAAIIADDLRHAAAISNGIAPEHLEIMTRAPMKVLPLIQNAGAIFLGSWSPEALGDYSAGPNHTLPTGGTSRFFSPLGVYDFYKRSSLISFTEEGFSGLAKIVETIADVEGLEAHANTIRIRKNKTAQAKKKRKEKR